MKNFIDGIFFNENSKLMKSIIIEYVKILKVFDIVDHNKSNFFKNMNRKEQYCSNCWLSKVRCLQDFNCKINMLKKCKNMGQTLRTKRFNIWLFLLLKFESFLYIRWTDKTQETRIYTIYEWGSQLFSLFCLNTSCSKGVQDYTPGP